jgi:anaerobic magnesium-protoporphyrin IX monomethyl ester cyclase
MRVCLVCPPSNFLIDERVFPSLGILRIGAALEQAKIIVDHLDLSGVANYEDATRDYSGGASHFLITATTPQLPAAIRIAHALPKESKKVFGGPHATMVNAAAKKGNTRAQSALKQLLDIFDVVVAGEGDKCAFMALHSKGLIDADDPKSLLWNSSKDFADAPWPARHLIDADSYHYYVSGVRAMSLVGQLSCPYRCSFCGGRNSSTFRQIRKRPWESIVDEMRFLHDTYGVSGMMFMDDELNVNKSIVDLMRGIAAMGIDWRLRGFVKAELFTAEQAESMYAAGFRQLLCGFESAHPKILENIKKIATQEDNTNMLRIAHKHGLQVKALMSFGHPGESEETILTTRDWLLEEKPSDFDCTVITLYPGTPYYDESKCVEEPVYVYETNGDKLYSENMDFTEDVAYYKGLAGAYKAFVWTDYLTRERLAQLRDEVEEEVRSKLDIPYPTSVAELNYSHSMGQGLPSNILRSSK